VTETTSTEAPIMLRATITRAELRGTRAPRRDRAGEAGVSVFGRTARNARHIARLEQGIRHPGRYVRNRAISKTLGALGFWRAFGRLWR
jgi:hypothetical protein